MTADTQAQGDLPELPVCAMRAAPVGSERWPFPKVGYFTADQMREYGRACVAAALQGRGTQEGEPSEAVDAARYRWLRSSCSAIHWNRLGHYGDTELDAQIDSARAALAQAQKERNPSSVEIRVAPVVRPWDTAAKHYHVHDDGLAQPWHGRVWLSTQEGEPSEAEAREMDLLDTSRSPGV